MSEHEFEPRQYYHTLGPHPPVLYLDPGDTLVTWTVDARGYDAQGRQVTQRGNPQVGPFALRGAAPGDVLVVELLELTPSRNWGFSHCYVDPGVLDPQVARTLPEPKLLRWELDVDRGVACVAEPNLPEVEVPLDPMLGCFGVAPQRHQAISTATSGPHGGNMDCRLCRVGAKLYFPVFEPGGLFFLGDGHAAQGDGEILGMGIEISMRVRVRLDLVPGWKIQWPRGENPRWLFTLGNARPLMQALQHATTEMLHWLTQTMELPLQVAHPLLGQRVRYEVGNVFDPAYTMACKLAKEAIPSQARSWVPASGSGGSCGGNAS